jgi:hypothetical protein
VEEYFETFDYEAIRFLQVMLRNSDEPVEILEVGIRPLSPGFKVAVFEPQLGGLANINGTVFTPLGKFKAAVRQADGVVSADLTTLPEMELKIVSKINQKCRTGETLEEHSSETDRRLGKQRWRLSGQPRRRTVKLCFVSKENL